MYAQYKETFSFSSFMSKADDLDECVKSSDSEKMIKDMENSLSIFFNSPLPDDLINQVKNILLGLRSSSFDFKTFILSFNYIPRIIFLTNSLNFSNENGFEFENIFPLIEFIDVIISNNSDLINPDILRFCFNFLDTYFKRNKFPNFLDSIHFLMRIFKNHICSANMHLFDEHFFSNIGRFAIYDEQLHNDITQVAQRYSVFITEISKKYQYYFEFLKYLIEINNQVTSHILALTLKNIIKKKPYFDSDEQSWAYKAIIDFSASVDYSTQAVSFEICGILDDPKILKSIMLNSKIKSSIKSIIKQNDLSDIRLIPVVHALSHFLKIDPLNCSKTFIVKDRSNKLAIFFVKYVCDGPFELKVDAGYLLAESMRLNAFSYIYGISDDLSFLYLTKIDDLKIAILEILEIGNEDNHQLLISILTGLYMVCQECIKLCCVDDIKKIQDELSSSGIFEKVDDLKAHSDSEIVISLCQNIFDCFEFEKGE